MLGLMLKSTHEEKVELLNANHSGQVSDLRGIIKSLRGTIANLREANENMIKQNGELHTRLSKAVEGLGDDVKRILEAQNRGNYIYEVYFGLKSELVEVPMDSKNYDRDAKAKAAKIFGFTHCDYRGLTAKRWTL